MDLDGEGPRIQNTESQTQVTTNQARSYGGVDNDTKEDDKDLKTKEDTFSFTGVSRQQKILLLSMGFLNFCACTCFSLLAPFYPKEAGSKGVSESVIGLVFAVFELVIFLTSPIFGNYITQIGSKFMFISGVSVCGVCAILFGYMYSQLQMDEIIRDDHDEDNEDESAATLFDQESIV